MQGFAIGNGLTNPEIQYKAYTDYALEMNLIQKSEYDSINKIYPECQLATKLCGKSYFHIYNYPICWIFFLSFSVKLKWICWLFTVKQFADLLF